jgi:hypothetical protein
MKFFKRLCLCLTGFWCFVGLPISAEMMLNRPHFKYKNTIPPLPAQSKDYLNIVNYNIHTARVNKKTLNAWTARKPFFFKTVNFEDESKQLMQEMQRNIQRSVKRYLPVISKGLIYKPDLDCTTCFFSDKEPLPICETEYFRIALKLGFDDKKGCLYGNFPYPYRMIIALKRHASRPNRKEWGELHTILEMFETKVCQDIGAEYSSYACLQDIYHKNKNNGKKVAKESHYFMHFIFRFPQGIKIKDISFEDPNPYDQFQLSYKNLVKECEDKACSNFIYKKMPDIINTQEVTFEQANDLKKEMPLHSFIGYTAYDGTSLEKVKPDDWIEEIVVIGYRTDRFECLDHGVRWLSLTPEKPSMCASASRNRIIVWVKLQDIETERIFYIFNTHYDHLGPAQIMVDVEVATIKEIAKDHLWFAAGERFYKHHNGQNLYQHYLNAIECSDIRDISIMGHYGEAGSWGGFESDPFACKVEDGDFECDTLDNFFTNAKRASVLLSYTINGAYNPQTKELYQINSPIKKGYRLASDHFMTGFYALLN